MLQNRTRNVIACLLTASVLLGPTLSIAPAQTSRQPNAVVTPTSTPSDRYSRGGRSPFPSREGDGTGRGIRPTPSTRSRTSSRERFSTRGKSSDSSAPANVRSNQSIGQIGKQVTNLTTKRQSSQNAESKAALTVRFSGPADLSLCVLMMTPAFVSARRDDAFRTEVQLSNPKGKAIDDFSLEVYYDRDVVTPLSVDDRLLLPFCAERPEILVDRAAGVILVRTSLSTPLSMSDGALLSFDWKALRRSDGARIEFGPGTRLNRDGVDVLGRDYLPRDGVIPTRVEVLPPLDLSADETEYELVPHDVVANLAQDGGTSLTLYGPARSVAVGQDFYVDVWLDNPQRLPIDQIQFHLNFDVNRLQVVDDDIMNWIILGVNVHDGAFREKYPFDYHTTNSAFNALGEIYYGAGSKTPVNIPRAGAFARVRFRAIASGVTPVEFIMENKSPTFPTKVTFLSENILGALDDANDGARGCEITIID